MIVIIDYNMGNTGSVHNALAYLGAETVISNKEEDIKAATHIILPGVGAFGDGMKNLGDFGLIPVLNEQVMSKHVPFLGICLGMQLLLEVGEEGGEHKGLGWISGKVRRFKVNEQQWHIPHVGWDDTEVLPGTRLFEGIDPNTFYFTHSYIVPAECEAAVATCAYGEKFCSALAKGNIFGVQFHPEKSQKSGLKLLENFINLTK